MRGLGVAPPVTVLLGVLGLALVAAWVPLAYLTRDLQAGRDGAAEVFVLACGLPGFLVARRQPWNPEGWLLLGVAVCGMAVIDTGLYAVLDYRLHDGRLPLGEAAVFLKGGIGTSLIFLFALVILVSAKSAASMKPRRRRSRRPFPWMTELASACSLAPGSQVSPADQRRITGGARASHLWFIYDLRPALEHNSGPTISAAVPTPIARLLAWLCMPTGH